MQYYVELQCFIRWKIYAKYLPEYLKVSAGTDRKIFRQSLYYTQYKGIKPFHNVCLFIFFRSVDYRECHEQEAEERECRTHDDAARAENVGVEGFGGA